MKILSVDDNIENRYLIETIAKAHGHQVVSAENGCRALESLAAEHFDLIISDVLMPEMDGFQLCREVMSRPVLRDVPFIFYTATYTSKRDEQFGLSLGATRFLIKPLDPEEFMQVVSEILEEKPVKSSIPPALQDESSYLRGHNERLATNLGKKIAELQTARSDLEFQLAEKETEIRLRKKAEEDLARSALQLSRANQDLLQFAYAAAHDLQEPLRNVAHILSLLKITHGSSLDEEASALIDTGVAGLRRMHNMVTDLLTFTKIGDVPPEDCPPLDANLVLQEVLQNLVTALNDSHGQLTYQNLPGVRVKRTHLVQLFQNLLSNALKYSRAGVPATIRVSAVPNQHEACFTVQDNGIGFEPAYAEQIFGIFKRLHPSHEYEGTGIGLAICSRIVNLYGGRIWAVGTPNEGSKFHFTLPLAEPAVSSSPAE